MGVPKTSEFREVSIKNHGYYVFVKRDAHLPPMKVVDPSVKNNFHFLNCFFKKIEIRFITSKGHFILDLCCYCWRCRSFLLLYCNCCISCMCTRRYEN